MADSHVGDDSIVYLKPSEVAQVLAAAIKARENICLISPPGCGKSSLVAQAAEETKNDLIVSLPSVEDVTEPGGFPWIAEDHTHAQKVLFGQAYKAVCAKEPTIWHLEDFGQATPAVQAAYMQWAWAREVNGYRLPDHVTITMATNRRTDKAGVSGILEPVKGRFTLVHMRSDLDDFCNNLFTRGTSYGLTDDAIAIGVAFLRFRPELLNQFSATADLTNSPTERNWVAAFKHTDSGLPKHIEHALIAGRVGAGAAAEFLGFLRIYRELPSLDAILADPEHGLIPELAAARYAVAAGLASRANSANFDRIGRYADKLEKAKHGEFAVLLLRDSMRRDPKIQNSTAFIKLASTNIGKLIQGKGA